MALEYKLPYTAVEVDEKLTTVEENVKSIKTLNTEVAELTTRLNTLANSDDITLDQMKEVVDYIKNNKDLINTLTEALDTKLSSISKIVVSEVEPDASNVIEDALYVRIIE